MTPEEFLAQFPGHAEFSRKSRILLFAYYLRKHRGSTQFAAVDLRECFEAALIRVPTDLNALLQSLSKGRNSPLIRVRSNASTYALSVYGVSEVETILPVPATDSQQLSSFLSAAVPHLKRVIARIADKQRQEFLAEAISCLGVGARRATVIMTWVVAFDHLQEYVITHHLPAFNAALQKRSDRLSKLVIANRDDFAEIRESQFIEVCRSANIITNDIRKLLDEKLGFRNSCAHPSSIQIGDSKVVSFIEDLVDNVVVRHQI